MVVPAFGIGVFVSFYLAGNDIYRSVFWTGTTMSITHVLQNPISSAKVLGQGMQYAWTTSPQTMARAGAVRAGMPIAGVALAGVSGMVVGTVVAQAIWGDQGARDALTFYGFDAGQGGANYWEQDGKPGYFNIGGNVETIFSEGFGIKKGEGIGQFF